jgi:glycine hydroxymethyltransferase
LTDTLSALFDRLQAHEHQASRAFNLTPSENRLSPLAQLPFTLDAYARYFLDDLRLFGQWCFPAGRHLGAIEREMLHPLLKTFTNSEFVNVRPISGINCMTIVLAALIRPGDHVLVVPAAAGGHASTRHVAARLGAAVRDIPFVDPFAIDLASLETILSQQRVRLIYLDQSTQLAPLDPQPIRDLIDAVSPGTLIHYDSSHVNGLILGAALPNPLQRGADTFGGSTHKTLPGPHKGFIATNSPELAKAIESVTDHFVSQHKMAEVISLAITLIEFRDCGGDAYARQIIENARAFADEAALHGMRVARCGNAFTHCHQVWIEADPSVNAATQRNRLDQAGILANSFPGLPGIAGPAFRLSTAELTRLGATAQDARQLARAFVSATRGDTRAAVTVQAVRRHLREVRYCHSVAEAHRLAAYVTSRPLGAPPGRPSQPNGASGCQSRK